ncbi:MAG: hypothetical protein QOG00_3560, partial [Pyrinomonadaceae bacterium]|nr:hypothetical protein [Pyrinomonadaceae bacterium]
APFTIVFNYPARRIAFIMQKTGNRIQKTE